MTSCDVATDVETSSHPGPEYWHPTSTGILLLVPKKLPLLDLTQLVITKSSTLKHTLNQSENLTATLKMTLKDKVTSVVTGDAYDKPAKTKDGAMTTQGSSDAHTLEGTSADPNPPEPGKSSLEKIGDKASDLGKQAEDKASQAQDKADNTQAGQKAKEAANKS